MAAEIRIAGIPADSSALAANLAVRDWLESQARVADYWRDVLVDQNGDLELIEALEAHSTLILRALS